MSVIRIGAMLQPAWMRAAIVLEDTGSTLARHFELVLEETATAARDALDHKLANILAALLTPASVMALVFGLWGVTADMEWTTTFPISAGFFSHWQVWIALAIGLKLLGSSLNAHAGKNREISEEN